MSLLANLHLRSNKTVTSTHGPFLLDRGLSIQSTSEHFVHKCLTWTVETHTRWHLRAIVFRSEHNESTQTFEQTTKVITSKAPHKSKLPASIY